MNAVSVGRDCRIRQKFKTVIFKTYKVKIIHYLPIPKNYKIASNNKVPLCPKSLTANGTSKKFAE